MFLIVNIIFYCNFAPPKGDKQRWHVRKKTDLFNLIIY